MLSQRSCKYGRKKSKVCKRKPGSKCKRSGPRCYNSKKKYCRYSGKKSSSACKRKPGSKCKRSGPRCYSRHPMHRNAMK